MNNRHMPSLIFLAVSLCFLLTACGNSAKSEKEVAFELSEIDSYFISYGLELESYSVEKRQTNKDDKNDFIWITIAGSNDLFDYSADYEVTYVLYNDGWRLENHQLTDSSYMVTADFDRTELEQKLLEEYESFEYISSDRTDNTERLHYTARKETVYSTITYSLTFLYSFDPIEGWTEISSDLSLIQEDIDPIKEIHWYYTSKYNSDYAKTIDLIEKLDTIDNETAEILNDCYEKVILYLYESLGLRVQLNGIEFTSDETHVYQYISRMPEKTSSVIDIENKLSEFLSSYGKWLGFWNINSEALLSDLYIGLVNDGEKLTFKIYDNIRFDPIEVDVDFFTEDYISYHYGTTYYVIEYTNDDEISYGKTYTTSFQPETDISNINFDTILHRD